MPIIPSNWTGSVAVNAIGIGGSGSTSFAYAKQLNATITELDTFIDLIGTCDEPISREVSLNLISGSIKLYWKGLDDSYTQIQIFTRQSGDALVFNSGYNFVDLTLGQLGLSIKCSEITEISLVLRWDKNIAFDIYTPDVPVPSLTVEISNNNIINFINYESIESFTLIIGETFNYSNGVLWSILGYFKNSFNGLYENSNSALVYQFSLVLTELDRIIEFSIDFDLLLSEEFLPELKLMKGYENPEDGTVPDDNVTIVVTYDELTRTFTINK